MDTLYFFSKSKDVLPGKGCNEFVNDIEEYKDLANIKDWRKILSNFYIYPFEYDGKRWNTAEHAFQSKKIEIVDKETSFLFSLDSNSDLSKGNGEVARKHRKIKLLSLSQQKEWNSIKHKVLYAILFEKFTQCEIARIVLTETKHSILTHSVRSHPIRQYELEKVRELLSKEK